MTAGWAHYSKRVLKDFRHTKREVIIWFMSCHVCRRKVIKELWKKVLDTPEGRQLLEQAEEIVKEEGNTFGLNTHKMI